MCVHVIVCVGVGGLVCVCMCLGGGISQFQQALT